MHYNLGSYIKLEDVDQFNEGLEKAFDDFCNANGNTGKTDENLRNDFCTLCQKVSENENVPNDFGLTKVFNILVESIDQEQEQEEDNIKKNTLNMIRGLEITVETRIQIDELKKDISPNSLSRKEKIEQEYDVLKSKGNAITAFGSYLCKSMTTYQKAQLLGRDEESISDDAVQERLKYHFNVPQQRGELNEQMQDAMGIGQDGLSAVASRIGKAITTIKARGTNKLPKEIIDNENITGLFDQFKQGTKDAQGKTIAGMNKFDGPITDRADFHTKKQGYKDIKDYRETRMKNEEETLEEQRKQQEKQEKIDEYNDLYANLKTEIKEFNQGKDEEKKFTTEFPEHKQEFDAESKKDEIDEALDGLKKIQNEFYAFEQEQKEQQAETPTDVAETTESTLSENRETLKGNTDITQYALELYEQGNYLNALHCTDRVDKVYQKKIGKSVYDCPKKYNKVHELPGGANSESTGLGGEGAGPEVFKSIAEGDHLMIDHPKNGKYNQGTTHSVIALGPPDENGIVKTVGYPNSGRPPVIEYYNLHGNGKKDGKLEKYYGRKDGKNLKNGKVIRINSPSPSSTS